MAKAIITFCEVGGRTKSGGTVTAIHLNNVKTEVITTLNSSQVANTSSTARYGFVSVTAFGGPIWVAGGNNPTANEQGVLILDGHTKDFALEIGEKVAVINAVL